jgi:uncharacterized membrane protein YagU involved in acid resistance
MPALDIWNILGIVSILFLIIFFAKGKNALWGGLSIGVLIGLIIALVYVFKGQDFNWIILKKAAIIGTLAGLVAEMAGRLSKKISN